MRAVATSSAAVSRASFAIERITGAEAHAKQSAVRTISMPRRPRRSASTAPKASFASQVSTMPSMVAATT